MYPLRDVSNRNKRRQVGQNNVKRKARRVRHSEEMRGYDQFTAVYQRDSWRQCPNVQQKRYKEDCA